MRPPNFIDGATCINDCPNFITETKEKSIMKTKNIIGLLLLTFTSMFCVGQNVALESQKNIAELTRSLTKNAKNDEQKVEYTYC